MQEAIRRLLADPDNYQTSLEVRRLMFSLRADEISGVLDLLLRVAEKDRTHLQDVCGALYARWAELDPKAACASAIAGPAKKAYGFSAIHAAFDTWAAADLGHRLAVAGEEHAGFFHA